MSAATATLSSKYQISIPKEVRDTLNLKPGQKLVFISTGSGVRLVPAVEVKDLFGLLKNVRSKNGGPINTDDIRDRSPRREEILPKLGSSKSKSNSNSKSSSNKA